MDINCILWVIIQYYFVWLLKTLPALALGNSLSGSPGVNFGSAFVKLGFLVAHLVKSLPLLQRPGFAP